MADFLETTVDKFIFKVATDRLYTAAGVWAVEEQGRIRVGITDYQQQLSGDATFARIKSPGTVLAAGDELAEIETIKAVLGVHAPAAGTLVEVNSKLDLYTENINQDPYGAGWLAVIEPADWAADRARLLDAAAYLAVMKAQAEKELNS